MLVSISLMPTEPLMKASFVRTLSFLAASAVLLIGAMAFRPAGDAKHIKFSVPSADGTAGEIVWVTIKAKTDKHWHTYSTKHIENEYGLGPIETTIELKDKKIGAIEGKLKVPKPHIEYDEGFEVKIETLEGSWEWQVPIRLKKDLKGAVKGVFTIGFQMCDTTSCLPPDYMDVPFTVTVSESTSPGGGDRGSVNDATGTEDSDAGTGDGGQTTQTPTADKVHVGEATLRPTDAPVDTQDEIAAEKRKGLFNFFFYAMGIGFLALLTPCVFPMIPITVSFFTKRNEKERSKAVRDAFIYALGIISTFTLIGIVFSALFGATSVQDLAANPWMNLGIGVLFVALAFNLFGAYEIQVPVSIMNKLNKKAQGTGVFAVLLMGLVFSLTSFTCTVPFVGTLLLSAAGGDYLYPAVGTLGFATAFAIPFFFLALFPSLLVALPRAGGWMNNLKVVMGFLEIAAAVKFFSTAEFVWGMGVMPRDVFLAIWVGVVFIIVMYILGSFEMKLDTKVEKVSGLRAFFAVIFASIGFYFFNGMMGNPLAADLEALLPPDNYAQLISMSNGETSTIQTSMAGSESMESRVKRSMGFDHSAWLNDLATAKKQAAETGKPIFIDFTGFACTNCRLMEKNMFPRASIQQRFDKMILVQLFTDRKEEPYITNQNIMREYGTVANPLYVILNSDGSYVGQSAFTRDESAFLSFLDQAFTN
jgi:thiol:disulfide interchange protein